MGLVSINDGLCGVLARKMSALHYTIHMFWFSALGFAIIGGAICMKSAISHDVPSIF